MKSKKYKIILITCGVAVALIIGACTSKYCHRSPEKHAQWMVEKVTDKLDLNQVQQEKIKDLSQVILTARQAMKSEKEQKHKDILAMLEQPKLDRSQVLNKFNQHIDKFQLQAPAVVNSFGDFYDTLSDEQREKLRDKLKDHFEHHHHKSHW